MAQAGDFYTIELKLAHLKWGEHRYTNSRGTVYGEGYIAIPARIARSFDLLNLNGTNGDDIPGKNIFFCKSVDGLFEGTLRAQGNQESNSIYAKQFSGDKDLKAVGSWYCRINAEVGDIIKVSWQSPYDILIEKL